MFVLKIVYYSLKTLKLEKYIQPTHEQHRLRPNKNSSTIYYCNSDNALPLYSNTCE